MTCSNSFIAFLEINSYIIDYCTTILINVVNPNTIIFTRIYSIIDYTAVVLFTYSTIEIRAIINTIIGNHKITLNYYYY